MWRLSLCMALLAGTLLAISGCAPGAWDEFLKDLRGDNMQMRSSSSPAFKSLDQSKPQ